MKKYNFFKTDGRRPSQEQLLDTQLFYQNAPEIFVHFEEWKDIDRFYFIPLYMEMTYSCGWVAEIAPRILCGLVPLCAAPWSIRNSFSTNVRSAERLYFLTAMSAPH